MSGSGCRFILQHSNSSEFLFYLGVPFQGFVYLCRGSIVLFVWYGSVSVRILILASLLSVYHYPYRFFCLVLRRIATRIIGIACIDYCSCDRLKLGSGVGWRSDNCHFGGVRGGSPAKKKIGLRLCGTHFLSLRLI